MAEKLKREFIELLEQDKEFRYTVAGYLGLSEILKRLDRLEEGQNKLWENQNRLWEEIKKLREGQDRLWENQNKLWENQNRLWEEVRSLREGQNKLWEEVKALREGQNKLWEEVRSLREGQNRLWEEVRALRESQNKLTREQERTRRYMIAGFRDLSKTLGVTFEEHASSFLEVMLIEMGYPHARVDKKHLICNGEIIEIDMFCEEPLVVGEVTIRLRSSEEARREVEKLIRHVRAVKEKYKREPFLTILSVARITPEAAETLETLAEKHGIRLILGKEIEESLRI